MTFEARRHMLAMNMMFLYAMHLIRPNLFTSLSRRRFVFMHLGAFLMLAAVITFTYFHEIFGVPGSHLDSIFALSKTRRHYTARDFRLS